MTSYEIKEYAKCVKDPVYFVNTYGRALNITSTPVKVDPIVCFDYQADILRKYQNFQNNIVLKSRQCLPADTFIDTPEGPIAIQHIKPGQKVYSYNKEINTIQIDTVHEWWESGDRQCVKVKFKNSGEIEVGEKHPFMSTDKVWIQSKDLTPGTQIIKTNDFNEIIFDTVESITYTDIKMCFDISVSMNENYFIKGLLTHNTGLSVITAAFVAWSLCFKTDQRILIVANDRNGAVRFLTTVKQFLEFLPAFLKPSIELKNNETEIVFGRTTKDGKIIPDNKVQAVAAGPNAGRGESLTMLILDETAFIDNAESIWMAAALALSGTKGKCIMISTPFGTGTLYHKTWIGANETDPKIKNDFIPTQIHWTEHPVYNIGKNKIKDAITGLESFTSPWYEKQCEQLNYDRVKIAQELDLSFEGSRALVIDNYIVEKFSKNLIGREVPPHYYNWHVEIKKDRFIDATSGEKTSFWVWKLPEPGASYIIGCLPQGEKVMTDKGLKNIEEVTFNDKLYDENGTLTTIKNVQVTPAFSDKVYEFKLANIFRTTTFTGNHPILCSIDTKLKRNYLKKSDKYKFNERYWDFNFEYHKAENIKKGDWIKFPNIYINELSTAQIDQQWDKYKDANRTDFTIDNPLHDEEFWWYIGIWLAEGWTYKKDYTNSIITCHNINEKEHVIKICKLFKKYGRKVTCSDKSNNVTICQLTSTQIFNFINDNFGKYAKHKNISEWVKYIPKNLKLQLIKGYLDGDGCQFITSRNLVKTAFVSISLELLEGIQDILFSCGIISTLQKLRSAKKCCIEDRICNVQETYELNLAHHDSINLLNKLNQKHDFVNKNKRIINNCFISEDNKNIFFKIKKINSKSYSGPVYNFETESHTFLCKNITTHNCDVARGDGSDYSTIQIIDAVTCEQVAEFRDKVPPDILAKIIYKVANDYNKAYVAIEANNMGIATCLTLKNTLRYDVSRIYHSQSIKKLINHHYDVRVDEDQQVPGFQTTTTTRTLIVASLHSYMREGTVKLNSKRVLNEFTTFIYNQSNGKPMHAPGAHDDLIFALGIALLIRDQEFKNVFMGKEFYKAMMSSFSVESTNKNPTKEDIESEFKSNAEEQFKISNGNTNYSSDEDLRWLMNDPKKDKPNNEDDDNNLDWLMAPIRG